MSGHLLFGPGSSFLSFREARFLGVARGELKDVKEDTR